MMSDYSQSRGELSRWDGRTVERSECVTDSLAATAPRAGCGLATSAEQLRCALAGIPGSSRGQTRLQEPPRRRRIRAQVRRLPTRRTRSTSRGYGGASEPHRRHPKRLAKATLRGEDDVASTMMERVTSVMRNAFGAWRALDPRPAGAHSATQRTDFMPGFEDPSAEKATALADQSPETVGGSRSGPAGRGPPQATPPSRARRPPPSWLPPSPRRSAWSADAAPARSRGRR